MIISTSSRLLTDTLPAVSTESLVTDTSVGTDQIFAESVLATVVGLVSALVHICSETVMRGTENVLGMRGGERKGEGKRERGRGRKRKREREREREGEREKEE